MASAQGSTAPQLLLHPATAGTPILQANFIAIDTTGDGQADALLADADGDGRAAPVGFHAGCKLAVLAARETDAPPSLVVCSALGHATRDPRLHVYRAALW